MSYGLLPFGPEKNSKRLFAGGVLLDGKVTPFDQNQVTEDVNYSRYSSPSGSKIRDGSLIPDPHKDSAYTWIKAPRYGGKVIEVGPTARVLVDYFQNSNSKVKKLVEHYAAIASIKPMQLNSVLGRHLCRGICAVVIADFLLEECERLSPGKPGIADVSVPATGEGYGITEASRGGLLHYIRLADHKIEKYECVVPTTWNCSPRDDSGQPGAMESALIGTKVDVPAAIPVMLN